MSRNVSEAVRQRNLGTLLSLVHVGGPASRSSLAQRMGLNRSTIMALAGELTSAGLLSEDRPHGSGRAGRPSLVVRPPSERVYVLAFDVAVDRLVAARVGLGGVVLDRREAVRRRAGADLDSVVDTLSFFGRSLFSAAAPSSVCVGVGASYCGMIRPDDGMVRLAPDMGWVDQAFGASLSEALGLGLPVSVGNEAHLGARAEHLRGAGTGFRNLVYLHGDVGVGGGIIVGGRLLDGEAGYGCELGHIVIDPSADARPCNCGSRGCLEAEVGERALLSLAGRPDSLFGRSAVRSVVDAASAGEDLASAAVREVGDRLGIGVANLINLFNPGVVIFGGMLRDIYPAAAAQVRARIASNVLAVSRSARLCVSSLGDDACLIGASELAFSGLIANPLASLPDAVPR